MEIVHSLTLIYEELSPDYEELSPEYWSWTPPADKSKFCFERWGGAGPGDEAAGRARDVRRLEGTTETLITNYDPVIERLQSMEVPSSFNLLVGRLIHLDLLSDFSVSFPDHHLQKKHISTFR